MLSRGLAISQQMYFSTHNALFAAEASKQNFDLTFYQLRGSRHVSLSVYPLYDVQTIKRLLIRKLQLPEDTDVKDVRIIYKGVDLPNHRTMNTFFWSSRKLYWALKEASPRMGLRGVGLKIPDRLSGCIEDIQLAFLRNISPKLTVEGTGGTYILYNARHQGVALFKPSDEEAFAPCNPRGYEGQMNQRSFRNGVLSGEGVSREVAAYLLSSYYANFCSVPETTMIEVCHPSLNYKSSARNERVSLNYPMTMSVDETDVTWKTGSLQEFINAKESCGNYDPKLFSIRDVHQIGILDIRVMNLDRNDGNILVAPLLSLRSFCNTIKPAVDSHMSSFQGQGEVARSSNASQSSSLRARLLHMKAAKQLEDRLFNNRTPDGQPPRYRLIPIDHGFILPDVMDVASIDLVWFDWQHTTHPFEIAELKTIFSFDPDKDAERLKRKLFIRDECLRTMRVATRLLQIGATMHLNLHQLVLISCRADLDSPSPLEGLVKDAMAQTYKVMDYTSIVSTNRLGLYMDLAESSVQTVLPLRKQGGAASHSASIEDRVNTKQEALANHQDLPGGISGSLSGGIRSRKSSQEQNPENSPSTTGPLIPNSSTSHHASLSRSSSSAMDKPRNIISSTSSSSMTEDSSSDMMDSSSSSDSDEDDFPSTSTMDLRHPRALPVAPDASSGSLVSSQSVPTMCVLEKKSRKGSDRPSFPSSSAGKSAELQGGCEGEEVCGLSRGEDEVFTPQISSVRDSERAKEGESDRDRGVGRDRDVGRDAHSKGLEHQGLEDAESRSKRGTKGGESLSTTMPRRQHNGIGSMGDDFQPSLNHSSNFRSLFPPIPEDPLEEKEAGIAAGSCLNRKFAMREKAGALADAFPRSDAIIEEPLCTSVCHGTSQAYAADEVCHAALSGNYSPRSWKMRLRSLPSSQFFNYPDDMEDDEKRRRKKEKRKAKRKKKQLLAAQALEELGHDVDGLGSSAAHHQAGSELDGTSKTIEWGVHHTKSSTRLGTLKRLNGTTRGTAYQRQQRSMANNTTWTLHDKYGKPVPVDWEDERFESLFFEIFVEKMKKFIQQKHPNWRSYPYNGSAELKSPLNIE